MGTTYTTKREGESLLQHVIRTEFSGPDCKVLDSCSRGNVHYLAVRLQDKLTFAVVALTSRDGSKIGVKVMDESMGPYYHDAPKRLLEKLDPPVNQWAAEWRQGCLSRLKSAEPPTITLRMVTEL
jgi:hypothetical protein